MTPLFRLRSLPPATFYGASTALVVMAFLLPLLVSDWPAILGGAAICIVVAAAIGVREFRS